MPEQAAWIKICGFCRCANFVFHLIYGNAELLNQLSPLRRFVFIQSFDRFGTVRFDCGDNYQIGVDLLAFEKINNILYGSGGRFRPNGNVFFLEHDFWCLAFSFWFRLFCL